MASAHGQINSQSSSQLIPYKNNLAEISYQLCYLLFLACILNFFCLIWNETKLICNRQFFAKAFHQFYISLRFFVLLGKFILVQECHWSCAERCVSYSIKNLVSLEKMLVDVFCDKTLFLAHQSFHGKTEIIL